MAESMLWNKGAIPKVLNLEFELGDEILTSIEAVLKENGIGEAKVLEASGKIKEGSGTYLLGNSIRTKNFANTEVKAATGNFKMSSEGMFGILKIIPADLNSHVTIAKAKAADLKLKLSYFEFEK